MMYIRNVLLRFCALSLTVYASCAYPAQINFSGQLTLVFEDSGTAAYSGVPIGTVFTGTIDDVTGSGQISGGNIVTNFSCCNLVAQSPTIENDRILTAEEANILNSVSGSNLFTANDLVDSFELEGDALTATGSRIEVGLSYILLPDTFSDSQQSGYPFDSDKVLLPLFFILEEDATGDIYDAIGTITTNEVPPADVEPSPEDSEIPGQLLARDLDGNTEDAEAYYDPVLDITWLKNANLALSETFDVPNINANGVMDLSTARLWINTMNSVAYLGQTAWRMPTLTPVAGGDVYNNSYTNNATSDVGNALPGVGWVNPAGDPASEIGHLYYVTLGNIGRFIPNGDGSPISQLDQPGWGQPNVGPFNNINLDLERTGSHWYGLDNVSTVFNAPTGWYFIFLFGSQSVGSDGVGRHVWPVHDGDIGSPLLTNPTEESDPTDQPDTNTEGSDPMDDPDTSGEQATSSGSGGGGGSAGLWFSLIGLFSFYRRQLFRRVTFNKTRLR